MKRFAIACGAIAALYLLLAISPVPRAIGRSDPALASWFRPLLFNFSESYPDGEVLEFRVGMSRRDLATVLRRNYQVNARLIVNCKVSGKNLVAISSASDQQLLESASPMCVRVGPRRLLLQFDIADEKVTRIKVTLVRVEGI